MTWSVSCMATAFSTSFDTFKFENCWNCSKSASDFFNVGNSVATFRASGTTPVDKDKLMILVIVGSNTVRQPFKTTAGRGSSSQDLDSGFLENFFYFLQGNLSKVTKLCTTNFEKKKKKTFKKGKLKLCRILANKFAISENSHVIIFLYCLN